MWWVPLASSQTPTQPLSRSPSSAGLGQKTLRKSSWAETRDRDITYQLASWANQTPLRKLPLMHCQLKQKNKETRTPPLTYLSPLPTLPPQWGCRSQSQQLLSAARSSSHLTPFLLIPHSFPPHTLPPARSHPLHFALCLTHSPSSRDSFARVRHRAGWNRLVPATSCSNRPGPGWPCRGPAASPPTSRPPNAIQTQNLHLDKVSS